jgi:hypothetical protein
MKLSSIMVNRNDGYKDFKRGIIHFKSMLETFDEINYIDWNSPNEVSFLWEIKDYLPKTGKIKHFIITPEIANKLIPFPDVPKCNETLSRNIALRRSQADWIVSTSIDIIPPKREDLINTIKTLNKNTFYTISRRDFSLSYMEQYNVEQWEELREKLYKEIPERFFPIKFYPDDDYILINSCGDFQLAHRDVWNKIKGFEENMVYALYMDGTVQKKAKIEGFNVEALLSPPLFHIEHLPYSIDNEGNRISSQQNHSVSSNKKFNDPDRFLKYFEKTENDDNWGLGNVDIEFEIY